MSLSARGLVAGYGADSVLHGIDLDLREGELAAIVGPNGAGKTTLLRCLAGLLRPASGGVTIFGADLGSLSRGEIARSLAVVPQATETLFPFTVREIVALGRVARLGLLARADRSDALAVDRAIADLELGALAPRRIDTLSGGERQRVVLAMALAQEPRILLLDEPTVHLDPGHQRGVLAHVRRLARDRGLVCAAVLHDLNLAGAMCDRVIVISGGRVTADGAPRDVIVPSVVADAFGDGLDVGERRGTPFVLPLG